MFSMNRVRKMLRLCLVVVLVISSLSAGMTVSAINTKEEFNAFSSIKVGGKKIVYDAEDDPQVDVRSSKVKVKVKPKKGWKIKKITCSYSSQRHKDLKLKNGGTFKAYYDSDIWLRIKAKKGKKTATIEVTVYKQ